MREKLIELIRTADKGDHESQTQDQHYVYMADQLIENGVTIEPTGCDYCQEDVDGYRKMMGFCSITNPFHGSTWQIATPHCRPIQIFFCPMCGRKLAEPPKMDTPNITEETKAALMKMGEQAHGERKGE